MLQFKQITERERLNKQMNIWQQFEKRPDKDIKDQGISFHYEKGIELVLKKQYVDFSGWLRKNYCFPVHINIYILNQEKVKLSSGVWAYGSFRWFENRPPRIKIPSKIEYDLLSEYTYDEIYEQILSSLVHELTHYFQWVLRLEQSNAVSERQANYYRYRIIDKYKKEMSVHNINPL